MYLLSIFNKFSGKLLGSEKKRSQLKVLADSVFALTMREVKTRFGKNRLGYFWAVAEPCAQALILSLIFFFIGSKALQVLIFRYFYW